MYKSILIRPLLILFCFIFLFASSLWAQKISDFYDIKFQKLSIDNGLPSNIISNIVQDKNGFIWIGTSNGLVRFDGVKMKIFQSIKKGNNGLPSNIIKDICVDSKGVLWLSTASGIVKFNPSLEKFTDLHLNQRTKLSKLRSYYSQLYLDDKERLSCYDMFTQTYIVIDTHTDSLLATFNEATLGKQNWLKGDKNIIFVDHNDFWILLEGKGIIVVKMQNGKISAHVTTKKMKPGLPTMANFRCSYKDKKGNIYCAINGLFVLPYQKKNTFDFEFIDVFKGGKLSKSNDIIISCITEDREGMIWISTVNHGLRKYNPKTKEVSEYFTKSINYSGLKSTNAYFLKDKTDNLWVVNNNSILQLYDYKTKDFIDFKHEPANQSSIAPDIFDATSSEIKIMFLDLSGNYWLQTQGHGLVYFSLKKTKFPVIKNPHNNSNSLSSNGIWGIYEDNKGLLWVGVKNIGLNIIDMNSGSVFQYRSNSRPEFSGFDICTDFLQTSDNEYWIGSIPLKRFTLDQKTHSLKMINEFKPDNNDPTSLSGWRTTDIFKDKKGHIWISTFDGLNLYHIPDQNHPYGFFKHYFKNDNTATAIANNQVWHTMEDNKGRLWISTGDGLSCMNEARNKTINYYHNSHNSLSLSSSNVKYVMQDRKGRIWIATEGGGLNRFIENENRFIAYNKSTGFPSDNIFAVFEDKTGNLWMSSTDGIIKFTVETNKTSTFTEKDGLQSKQFVAGAYFQNPITGKIYFGGDYGINHFYPDSIKSSTFAPNIAFVSLKVFNTEIEVGDEHYGKAFLTKALSNTDEIVLSYKENVFSIEFAALDYSAAKNIRYSYMLEGANTKWVETDADNKTLNFTNLLPGTYKLKVKSTNADGVWCDNVKTITIIITPPWWKSWWFISLLFAFIITSTIKVFRVRMNLMKKRNKDLEIKVHERTLELQEANGILEERQEQILKQNEEIFLQNEKIKTKQEEIIEQTEKLHAVDQQKLRFLTNISHEFRTPLTLILGSTEKLSNHEDTLTTTLIMPVYKMIQRNAMRMLRLLNQVLDISKLEAGEMRLHVSKDDLIQHIKPIIDSFKFIAENKSITFNLKISNDTIIGYFDADKVEKIIYNILSNAFKFTLSGGEIKIAVDAKFKYATSPEAGEVIINVEDSGVGIPENQVKHIFDRFYQVTSNVAKGTGIGLALTRDLVILHHGTIEVKSVLNQGSCFSVTLPLAKEKYLNLDIEIESHFNEVDLLNMALSQNLENGEELQNLSADSMDKKSKLPIILIVEDNFDLRHFLHTELSTDYQILEAINGEQGIELALKNIPDLIISDLMMPVVDGLTLCKTLKTDKHTAHIPIILLTAKQSDESRTEGYETGADSYISKPFQVHLLKARIFNLLQIRKKLRQRFSNEIAVEPKDITLNSADEKLLNNAMLIIEQNSMDENFNVEKLAGDLGIHRVQLSRKFLALTNENISDFIRIIRLKKAAKLLLSGKYSISEVCYQVGFKDPAHFTRVFSKQFNISPSKYIEENKFNV